MNALEINTTVVATVSVLQSMYIEYLLKVASPS